MIYCKHFRAGLTPILSVRQVKFLFEGCYWVYKALAFNIFNGDHKTGSWRQNSDINRVFLAFTATYVEGVVHWFFMVMLFQMFSKWHHFVLHNNVRSNNITKFYNNLILQLVIHKLFVTKKTKNNWRNSHFFNI